MPADHLSEKECSTRELIIQTMRSLISQYGESKVTVVDIARSLGMSHANVYRFFGSKAEILDAVVDDWLANIEAFIKGVASEPGTAKQKIEAVVMAIYQRRRSKFEKDAEFFLAFRRLIETHPDAIAKRKKALFDVLREIVKGGIAAGEFAPVDPTHAAMVLEDATAIFLHPLAMPATLRNPTQERLKRVIHTVLSGLSKTAA